MAVKNFISPNAPSFKVKLCGQMVKFENGCKSFDLDDEDEAAQCVELEKVMKRSPQMSQHVKLVDREAAEKAALEHRKMMEHMGGAISGPVSSADLGRLATTAKLAQRDEALKHEGNTPEAVAQLNKELADADLALTETSHEVVKDKEGFIPEEQAPKVDLETGKELPKQPESKVNPLANILGKNNNG